MFRASTCLAVGITGAAIVLAGCGSDEATTVTHTVVKAAAAKDADASEKRDGDAAPADAHQRPTDTVRHYYELVDAERFGAAWPLLPATVQREAGGFDGWRNGYAATVFTDADVNLESQSGRMAIVAVSLDSAASDACMGRAVPQGFAGTWTLERRNRRWTAIDAEIQQVSGQTPTLDHDDCPAPPPTNPPRRPKRCTPGYSPCLPPASDYDCSGGTGDGPKYTGTVQVYGGDPYGLDADGNRVGCEDY